MIAVALPLVPIGAGAALSAATFVVGSAAYIAQQVHGFRAPLPPLTGSRGKAGDKTLQELIADAIAGARVPVAMPPNPLGPNGSWGVIGLVSLAGLIGRGLSQLWGLFNNKRGTASAGAGEWVQLGQPSDVSFSGTWEAKVTYEQCPGITEPPPQDSTSSGPLTTGNFGGITSYRLDPGTSGSISTPCGPPGSYVSTIIWLEVGYPDGTTARWAVASFSSLTSFDRYSDNLSWTINLERQVSGGPVEPGFPDAPLPAEVPDPKPLPESPVLPAVIPPQPSPVAPPVPGGSPTPIAPGIPSLPSGVPVPPGTQPSVTPIPGARPTDNGELVPVAPLPVVITPPDWHFPIPGAGPVTGNGPRPVMTEMAKELGRLEQKLASLLNPADSPVDWVKGIEAIAEAILSLQDGATYTLTEECNPSGDPNYQPRSWDFEAPGALTAFGVIQNRLDALAEMIDQSLRAKQQVCQPDLTQAYTGTNYSVQFRSTVISPYGDKALRKLFRYRDQSGRPHVEHRNHWVTFRWESGPWQVISAGMPWGRPQVWAATEAEGKRVLRHAAAIAGVDLDDARHKWIVRETADPRLGVELTMAIAHDAAGNPWVATRDGSAAHPYIA